MYATRPIDLGTEPAEHDDHVVLRGMSWKDFEVLLALRGDAPGVRMYYLDGQTDLQGFGSWTLKNELKEAGAEPDECYVVGRRTDRELPDLVIEVEWSRKGLAKHEIYRRLGVRELWTLQRDGRLLLRVLDKGRYVERQASKVLPGLDVRWLTGFLAREPQSAAVRALRDEMRKRAR